MIAANWDDHMIGSGGGVYWLHESGAVDRLNEFGAWLTRVIG